MPDPARSTKALLLPCSYVCTWIECCQTTHETLVHTHVSVAVTARKLSPKWTHVCLHALRVVLKYFYGCTYDIASWTQVHNLDSGTRRFTSHRKLHQPDNNQSISRWSLADTCTPLHRGIGSLQTPRHQRVSVRSLRLAYLLKRLSHHSCAESASHQHNTIVQNPWLGLNTPLPTSLQPFRPHCAGML